MTPVNMVLHNKLVTLYIADEHDTE